MKEKRIVVRGAVVRRLEFETFEELEGYFLDHVCCRDIKSKVIGKVLIIWEREQ